MPPVEVVFYMEDDGLVPVSNWLDGLQLKHRAVDLKMRFEANPQTHTFQLEP